MGSVVRRPRWLNSPHRGALILLLMALPVGLVLANDYGLSVDEYANAEVGSDALEAYLGNTAAYLKHGDSLAHHGPSYFMVSSAVSRLATALVPAWYPADARHLTNYLTFLLGAAAFYALCLRLVTRRLAWMTTALFLTQPLLFGYAFVNQKDTPFMAAFLAILAVGLAVGDRLAAARRRPGDEPDLALGWRLGEEWKSASTGWKILLAGYLLLAFGLIVDLLASHRLLALMSSLVVQAYEGTAGPLVTGAFARLAGDAAEVPVEAYLQKLEATLRLSTIPVVLGLLGVGLLLARKAIPTTLRVAVDRHQAWLLPGVVGLLLGFGISIRPIGTFAGALVSLYWILGLRRRAVVPIVAVWIAAALAAYATWPYLWADPLRRFWYSLGLTTSFPAHSMLYRGATVSSESLPWHFFPTLAGVQLTEPIALLFAVGLAAMIRLLWRRRLRWADAAVVSLWILVPLFGLLGLGIGIYGNIRQLLFVLPAIFLVVGLGVGVLMNAVRKAWIQALLFAALIAPGVVGILQLHPYEHAYFNAYAGGVDGAWGRYQPSHWCTSLREAGAFVNAAAEPGAVVLVDGPVEGVRSFARKDLVVAAIWTALADPSFIVSCTRTPEEMQIIPGMEKVYEVRQGTAVYAEVFQASP